MHHHDGFLPSLQQTFLAADHLVHLCLSLIENLLGFFSFLLLGDNLSSEDIFLFFQSFALLVHGIDEKILFLLDFLEVANVILGSEGLFLGNCDI